MTHVLLLGRPTGIADNLASICVNEGYKLVDVSAVISYCRQLQSELGNAKSPAALLRGPISQALPAQSRDLQYGLDEADPSSCTEELRQCIVELARQLAPGWRLSIRDHRLQAPSGISVPLTSLEFIFIKMFALVEIGEPVSRKQIVKAFGEDYLSYDQNRIDTLVRRLRQKFTARAGIRLPLNTERVRGFSFGEPLIIDL
ncbi:Transcriptional regulatory protein, C terminal [Duganella sp. CF458]|uniref:helix-turn-helix domain-containing protein n=1 Tax=Duganella sp. CF458 TaxID=1884368 RepID=UPI0008DFD054|nr:helix-turn-helix domain-containing protein [Duganella sp. CF458]SFH00610.1 Transcriptional regulatory protein, C terminal [Duganella sp. CF458]